jgi:Dihaem cytochrome c
MKISLVITSILFIIGIFTIPLVLSDDDYEWSEHRQKSIGVANISNPVYKEECGSCHMAYPAGLLPAASWQTIMLNLDNHFDDNAEIDADTNKTITQYLLANSAELSTYRRSRKIMNTLNLNSVPLRITETPYFKHEHDEIPGRMITANKQVNSFSNCNACHEKAEIGLFDEDNVRIPGYGRWDD